MTIKHLQQTIDHWQKISLISKTAVPDTFIFDKEQQLDIVAKANSLSKTGHSLEAYGFKYKDDVKVIDEKIFSSVVFVVKKKQSLSG